jgi:mono/diheme cytochrome c family protein
MKTVWLSAMVLLFLAGCSRHESAPAAVNLQPFERAQAQKQYAELCAACHGSHARGAVGPDLTTSRFKYGKSRAAIEKSILDGRPGGMPAFGSYLKLEEVKTLADYLLTLQ